MWEGLARHPALQGCLLPPGAVRPGGPTGVRRAGGAGEARAAPDDARAAPRRVHPPGEPEGQGLPSGLRLPQSSTTRRGRRSSATTRSSTTSGSSGWSGHS